MKDIITAAEKEKTATADLIVVDCGGEIPVSSDDIIPSGNKVIVTFKVRSELQCRVHPLRMPHFVALHVTLHHPEYHS